MSRTGLNRLIRGQTDSSPSVPVIHRDFKDMISQKYPFNLNETK